MFLLVIITLYDRILVFLVLWICGFVKQSIIIYIVSCVGRAWDYVICVLANESPLKQKKQIAKVHP